ncbi:ATPase [Sporosarcina sp. P26b]|uniref:sensor histidine kinase n=1 Tax=Sporosarcina sp. P26b TaxID=2048253 RepID=UPI000C1658D7|nr:sensor histidine kinase [Sporosarcina sp. P26b]PIC95462.1 ATPase [Sporosarcina sp. P26b]
MLKSKLQKKILLIVTSLILFLMLLMLTVFVVTDYINLFDRSHTVGLQTAKMLSYMDTVKDGLEERTDVEKVGDLEAVIEHYSHQVDATFIVIQDKSGRILASPDELQIGDVIPFEDGFKAVVFGANYSMLSNEIIGPSVSSKAPIYNKEENQIIGVVTVGYLISDLQKIVQHRVEKLLLISLIILVLGILISYLLAKSIRKDTFGLEPEQIASFYMERKAILASIDEGIIAVDQLGKITLINTAARSILSISNRRKGDPIESIFPNLPVLTKLDKSVSRSFEVVYGKKRLVVSSMPLQFEGEQKGALITFRDTTEMMEVVNTLYEVRKYSDDLRAQAHEYTNKLYLISGLLQLGKYEEAIRTIQTEISISDDTNQFIFENIKDAHVQAILFGKVGKASEMKVDFEIDENSSLEQLPEWFGTGALTVILGNLIDNALEEVANYPDGQVSFFALDFGEDVIFEVSDNGKGIPPELQDELFKKGYSTKSSTGRGIGLANVDGAIRVLGGTIQVTSTEEGTIFSVYIPKYPDNEEREMR